MAETTTDIAELDKTVRALKGSVDKLIRTVQGEIDAGNVGLIHRVGAVERLIATEVESAAKIHKELETAIQGLKVKMAAYGFVGSAGGGAVLVAILQASNF